MAGEGTTPPGADAGVKVAAPADAAASEPRHARRRGNDGAVALPDAEMAVTGRHLPALDGLRAFAVAGVVAYHLDAGWARGGYLGVDLFFVLSGFLITSLLLEEWVRTLGIRLGAFWARRARRLLPALFLVIVAIALFVVLNGNLGAPASRTLVNLSQVRGDALAALFYVANWHFIFAHQSYWAAFGAPSPLGHTWSLAIEEQFYLVWPLVLLFFLPLARRRWRSVGVIVTVSGSLVSAALMAVLFHPGTDPTRVYFGTDTRIFDMLIGATVAMLAAARPQPGEAARRWLHALALPAAGLLGVFWVVAGSPGGLPPGYMFRGGFLLCAILAAVVIADVRQVHLGPLGLVLALRPLRYIGRISYGIYLWHWPIFVYLTPARTGLGQPSLDVVRIGLTIGISAASYHFVELPVRRRQWSGRYRYALAPAAAVVTASCLVVATIPAVGLPLHPSPTTEAVAVTQDGGVPGAGGYSNQLPIKLAPGRVIDPAHPLRIMLIGDSVMFVSELAIVASLEATGEVTLVQNAIPGWGLTTDTGWRTGLPKLIAAAHPDLIIGTWSWDDYCSEAQEAAGELCAVENPVRYKQELEALVRMAEAPGTGVSGVIFVQYPRTGPAAVLPGTAASGSAATPGAGEVAWDDIVRSLPAALPGKVMYLPVGASVLLGGKFATWLPPPTDPHAKAADWVRVRMIDNVHLCPAGAVRYADALLADLTGLYHLAAPKGAWWEGPWTSDQRYNNPAGSCPDDHPAA